MRTVDGGTAASARPLGDRIALLLGSGEFEPWAEEAERAALARARSGDGSVAILPTASATEGDQVFTRWGRLGLEHYTSLGIPAHFLPVKTRADASLPASAEAVASSSMIFFSGGKPSYLAATLRGTPLWTAVLQAVDRGAVFAGCSAGAMIAGASPPQGRARRRGMWTSGLDVVPGVTFGAHWDAAPRALFPLRDLAAATAPRERWFIGIDEHTAALADANAWEVFGSGSVHLRKGKIRGSFSAGQRFTLGSAGG